MKNLIFILLIAFSFSAQAQSPFHALPKPAKKFGHVFGDAPVSHPVITAYRFDAPTAGTAFFADGEIKVVTGLGFGLHRLHWVDSTQKYYDNFSIKPVIFASGNVTPSFRDNNLFAAGVMLGFLNGLINVGGIYTIPTGGTKGKFGLVTTLGISLNN